MKTRVLTTLRVMMIALLVLGALGAIDNQPPIASTKTFQAVCETDHPFWSGPERDTYREAQADADAHNNNVHGGNQYAFVE